MRIQPGRMTDQTSAPVALDADLMAAGARQVPARMFERERSLNRREALPRLGATFAHDGEARCQLGDPDDLLADDCPGRH